MATTAKKKTTSKRTRSRKATIKFKSSQAKKAAEVLKHTAMIAESKGRAADWRTMLQTIKDLYPDDLKNINAMIADLQRKKPIGGTSTKSDLKPVKVLEMTSNVNQEVSTDDDDCEGCLKHSHQVTLKHMKEARTPELLIKHFQTSLGYYKDDELIKVMKYILRIDFHEHIKEDEDSKSNIARILFEKLRGH